MGGSQNVKILVAVVLLVIAGVVIVRSRGGSSGSAIAGEMYFDVQSGELFIGPLDALPPVSAPSGGEGVRAVVYGCGSCDDPLVGHVAYLIKYSDEAKREIQSLRQQAQSAPPEESGALLAEADSYLTLKRMIAPPDAAQWQLDDGTVVDRLLATVRQRCGSDDLVPCRPRNP